MYHNGLSSNSGVSGVLERILPSIERADSHANSYNHTDGDTNGVADYRATERNANQYANGDIYTDHHPDTDHCGNSDDHTAAHRRICI